jgi:hypothetical protein
MKEEDYIYRINEAKFEISQNFKVLEEEVTQDDIIRYLIRKADNLEKGRVLAETYTQNIIYSLTKDKYGLLEFIDNLQSIISTNINVVKNKFPTDMGKFDFCTVEHIDENGNKELIQSCDIEEQEKINTKIYPQLRYDVKYPHD